MTQRNFGQCKSEYNDNAMIRAGSWKLLQAIARYHYARSDCPDRKTAWARIAGIKLKQKRRTGPKPLSDVARKKAQRAVRSIANARGYSAKELFGDTRTGELVAVRQHCYHHLHKQGLSYMDIGRVMGRDHSTVMHGVAVHMAAAT